MIQELVLVLDVRNGLGLAFDLFGASVFGSPPVAPKRVPKRPLRRPVEATGAGFLCPEFWRVRDAKMGRNRPWVREVKRWGVECMA